MLGNRTKKITNLQYSFLCLLNNNGGVSIHQLGKRCFKTWRSTSVAMSNLIKLKLIFKEQVGKNLSVTLTNKGKNYILDNWDYYQGLKKPKGL